MTEREEEALIPLVRNRKSKTKESNKISSTRSSEVSSSRSSRVSGFEQTIQVTSDHGKNASKRRRHLDESVKNMFSVKGDNSRQIYILIGIEVRQKSVTLKQKHK